MPLSKIDSDSLNSAAVGTAQLSATGTPSASNFLRGDNSWAVVEGVPAGSVIWYAANAAPTGFLKANGATISRTTYASLFSAIGTTFGAGDGSTTFLVPDLRGEFLRGWDDGRGVDSGRAFGSAQTNAMQDHRHVQTNAGGAAGGLHVGNYNTGLGSTTGIVAGASTYTSFVLGTQGPTENGQGTPNTAAENRPRNIALLACIKF